MSGKYINRLPRGMPADQTRALSDVFQDLHRDATQYQASGSGAVIRATKDKLGEFVSVKDFGAVGDGVTDDTAAIQAAIDDAQTTGKSVFVPAGTYLVNATLTIAAACALIGESRLLSIIKTSSTTADIIKINFATNIISGIRISNLSLNASSNMTAGWGVNITGSTTGTVYWTNLCDLLLGDKLANGINVESCFYLFIDNITVQRVAADGRGYKFKGIDSTSKIANVWMTRCNVVGGVSGTETTGLYIDSYSEGIYVSMCAFEFSGLDYGIYIRNTAGATRPVENLFFSQTVCDKAAKTGCLVDNGYSIHFQQCWFSSNWNGYGLWIAAGQDFSVNGGYVIANGQDGIRVDAGATQVKIAGNVIDGNGVLASNTYSGVLVAANATDFIITGNDFKRAGTTARHKHSVLVVTGTSDRYIIAHNNLYGYLTSAVSDGGSGVNKVVGSNIT